MLYKEIMAVCSEIHTKHITLCGQNVVALSRYNTSTNKIRALTWTAELVDT